MKAAEFEALKGKIALPDMDKHLVPLMLYRGSPTIGRMSRMWNFAITCMESEVESYTDMIKLSHNPDFAHLAGPHRPIQRSSLPGLFGRLIQNPFVTNNIGGLTEWVQSVRGMKFQLTPISIYTNDPNHLDRFSPWRIADWRPEVRAGREAKRAARDEVRAHKVAAEEAEREARRAVRRERAQGKIRAKLLSSQPQERLFYPYLAYRPGVAGDEAALVMEVNSAVARGLPDWLRADICQDLIVGVLSGEIDRASLKGSVRGATGKVLKMHPLKYGPLSIDAPIFSDDDRVTLADRLVGEDGRDWEVDGERSTA